MQSTPFALPLLAALALGACDMDRKDHKTGKVDAAAVERDIKGIETQWVADYNAKDVDAVAGHYAEDGALANPGMALATDSTARRSAITSFLADPALRIDFASDRVQVAKSGEIAYSRGHYTMQATDPVAEQPTTSTGSYLTVWKKQADGSWKAVEDFIVPGPPPPPPAQ